MDRFNKRHGKAIIAMVTATMLLVVMCLSNAFIASSATWFTYTTPPRNQNLIFAGYSAAVTDSNPLAYDSGNDAFDVGIMYEPLFGQNLATNTQINWLGKSISWVNSTAIDVVLRSDIYWVNLTTSGPVYYRPITAKDVNYTFWLYGGFHSSGISCTYLNGLRDRLENNGTNSDLNSFVIVSDHEFVVRLNPAFANSDVAFRAISKNVLILPWDVWTQIMADTKDGYAANPLSFANDWCPDGVQAMPQAWMVGSGMYLPWYHNTVSQITIMKRNDIWWGASDPDFGRLPRPLYIENYFFPGNQDVPTAVEYGDIDWDGNYIAGLQTIMTPTAFPNVHTYFWNLPYFPDGSALCIVPNHREYPVGEPWLAKAIAECINYTQVSAVDSYYLRTPSVLLLPVDDAIARQLVNTTIENQYQPTYNPTDALAIMNQYCFKGDGTKGSVNGQWYTKDGPTAAELALYPEYSSGDSKVVNALPNWGDGKVHVAIPTVNVGGTWNLIDIQGWTDVDAADQIVCYSVQQILGVNLVSDLLGPAGWSPAYVDAMNYVHGNSSFDFADYCMEGALNNNMFERYTQFFTGAYEGTWNHYGSYRNPTLTALIASLDTVPAGSAAQQSIANQIEQIVGSQIPIIPEGGHPNWYIYSDKYWIGFSDQYSNPLLPCGPYIGRAGLAVLHMAIWSLHPKNMDLNGDGIVDMKDIGLVARAFGAIPGSPRWNTVCDIYDNRAIDMKDIGAVARAFGTTYVYP
jgi:hypothetical protein